MSVAGFLAKGLPLCMVLTTPPTAMVVPVLHGEAGVRLIQSRTPTTSRPAQSGTAATSRDRVLAASKRQIGAEPVAAEPFAIGPGGAVALRVSAVVPGSTQALLSRDAALIAARRLAAGVALARQGATKAEPEQPAAAAAPAPSLPGAHPDRLDRSVDPATGALRGLSTQERAMKIARHLAAGAEPDPDRLAVLTIPDRAAHPASGQRKSDTVAEEAGFRPASGLPVGAGSAILSVPEAGTVRPLARGTVPLLRGGNLYDAGWIESQPVAQGDAEWSCLATALYFEARGEPIRGQFAVAEVILNRMRAEGFPKTVCGVVSEGADGQRGCQFSFACDGRPETFSELQAFQRAGKIARLMLAGTPSRLTGGATYFHAAHVNPSWARRFSLTATIGRHQFYAPVSRLAMN